MYAKSASSSSVLLASIVIIISSYEIDAKKFECPTEFGLYEHENCWQFYQCLWSMPWVKTCPLFKQWDQKTLSCRPVTDCERKRIFPIFKDRKRLITHPPAKTEATTTVQPKKFKCPRLFGYYKHENCWQYYECWWLKPYVRTCRSNMQWDQGLLRCRSSTDCEREPFPTTTSSKPFTTEQTEAPTTEMTTEPPTTTETYSTTTQSTTSELSTTYESTSSSSATTSHDMFGFECHEENGLFQHIECHKYYECSRWNAIVKICPDSTQFNEKFQDCIPIFDCPRPALSYECPKTSGYFKHENCWMFYQCGNGDGFEMICANGTQWDQTAQTCVHEYNCKRRDINDFLRTTTSDYSTTTERKSTTLNDDNDKTTTAEPTTKRESTTLNDDNDKTTTAEPTTERESTTLNDDNDKTTTAEPTTKRESTTLNDDNDKSTTAEPTTKRESTTLNDDNDKTTTPEPTTERESTTLNDDNDKTTTPEPTTEPETTTMKKRFECPEPSGYYEHENCWMFYQCGNGIAYEQKCPKGTQWDQTMMTCDHLSDCQRPDDDDDDGTTIDSNESTTKQTMTTTNDDQDDDVQTTTEEKRETTKKYDQKFECPESDGYYKHENCWMYYQCGNGIAYEQECPKGTQWSQTSLTCDHLTDCQIIDS